MRPLGPLFMAIVCSTFNLTYELPNHVTRMYDESALHRNRRLNYLHHKGHAKTSIRQFDANTREKREEMDRCDPFLYKGGSESIILTNPKDHLNDTTYSSNITCITKITAHEDERVVVLTFVGKFKMEQSPGCENDYLEIRDGEYGYSLPAHRYCGAEPPVTFVSSGPDAWLKFHSDDTIEHEGFQIKVEFQLNSASRKRHESCQKVITGEQYGEIGSHSEDVSECREKSSTSLDIQWRIETPPNTSIFLNFTDYEMALPNDCESNLVQVFGAEPDFDHKCKLNSTRPIKMGEVKFCTEPSVRESDSHLAGFFSLVQLCGSKSTPVTTKLPKEGFGPSNVMYVRMYASKLARDTKFSAQFTAFRTLTGQDTCDRVLEFDCEDGTCIDANFKCNSIANCRLKIDEECQGEQASALKEPHVFVMLSIFSIVLFAVGVFFLYTCIRKLHRENQYIKEQLQAKSQEHLDQYDDQLSFDSDGTDRLSVPGDSPERDNEANNYTRQMSGRKSGSIVSDLLQLDSSLDGDNDWPESTPILTDEIGTKHKSRPRRSDASKNRKVESPKIKNFNEEDRKEAEYKSRPRRSDPGNRNESRRTETTKEEKRKTIENKDKHKRRQSNKKEESPETGRRKEKSNKTEYTDRSKHDKPKEELSRTNTLKEDHKQTEHKSRPRREANKKEQSPTLKESKEYIREVELNEGPRRDTNKNELLTPKASEEEVSKETEVKGRPRHINRKEQLLTRTASKEEMSKDMEIKGRPRRHTNKKEQLLTPAASKEEVSKEIEDKGRHRQAASQKEESLRSKTTKETVNTGNKGRPRDTSKKEESLKTKSSEEMKESRDASVGTLNTVEFGCQTRESLFVTDPVTSSDGTNSSSNGHGLSAFACSSATIIRPSSPSPAAVTTSHITIDLQATPREPTIHADRRPMSSETTRSAPDVIIVAKRLS